MTAPVITVAIVDNHPSFVNGLAGDLAKTDDLRAVMSAGSIEALDRELLLRGIVPDVVFLDLSLPGCHGQAAIRHVVARGLRPLVISSSVGHRTVFESYRVGAQGYVSKTALPAEIAHAARVVARGDRYISPTLATLALDPNTLITFTPLQEDILELVAAGESDADIARQVHRTVKAVRKQLDGVAELLGSGRRRGRIARFYQDLMHPPWTDGEPPPPLQHLRRRGRRQRSRGSSAPSPE